MSLLLALTSTGYSLTCNPSSYTFTGSTINLSHGRFISADVGAYIFTSQNADLVKSNGVSLESIPFSFVGQNIQLNVGRKISANPDSYVFSGSNTNFLKGYSLVNDNGDYSFTGLDAGLVYSEGIHVSATSNQFTFIGKDVFFEYTPVRAQIPIKLSKKTGLVKREIFRNKNKEINPSLYK